MVSASFYKNIIGKKEFMGTQRLTTNEDVCKGPASKVTGTWQLGNSTLYAILSLFVCNQKAF